MVKDDGARGAEITVIDGELPYCPDCQIKHIVDVLQHIDPREKEKYAKAQWIYNKVAEQVGMNKTQQKDYYTIHELEHKFEDGLTVLRELRHKIQATPGIDNPADATSKAHCVEACRATGKTVKQCRAVCKE